LRYVVDASVAIRWFVCESAHPQADAVLNELVNRPERFAVPELFAYEVLAVLYRHHPNARMIFTEVVDRLLRSGVLRYPMTESIYTRMDRFVRLGLTGYDAVYVALAEELEGTWLTFDSRAHACISEEGLSRDLLADGFTPQA
jgi:predicted nucleic acid-binding protein